MDIDMMTENMIGSLSTQDSKNMHSSNDSNFNLMNLNFADASYTKHHPKFTSLWRAKNECWNDQSPKLSQDQQHVPNSLGPNPNSNK